MPPPYRRPPLVLALALLAAAPLFVARPAASDPSAAYPAAPLPAVTSDHAPDIEAAILAITRETLFKDAAIGIAVMDVDSGHYLAAYHEHDPLNPASNAKLFTAACALATLHGDHRYETTLSGRIKGSVVSGPLVLRGYGDPSLRSADLWEMAQELKGRASARSRGTSSSTSASSTSRPRRPPSSSSRTSGRRSARR